MIIRRPSRKAIVITGSLLLVIAVGVYAWASFTAWKAYEARLTKERAEYQTLQRAVQTGTPAERLKALRTLDDKLDDRQTICDAPALYAWHSTIIPPIRDGVATCEAAKKQLDSVAGPVGTLRAYLDVADALREKLQTLLPAEPLNESNWNELGVKRADSVKSALEQVQTDDSEAKALIEAAAAATEKLSTAWKALIAANQAKDRTAFEAANQAVTAAYAEFAAVADKADESIRQKVTALAQTQSNQ